MYIIFKSLSVTSNSIETLLFIEHFRAGFKSSYIQLENSIFRPVFCCFEFNFPMLHHYSGNGLHFALLPLLLYCLLLHPAYCLELGTTATASGSGNAFGKRLGNKKNCLVHWLNIFFNGYLLILMS
jgi:hypothetical protein